MIPEGMEIFAGFDEHLEKARNYIKINKLTIDDVSLLKVGDDRIIIRTKRELDVCLKSE